MNARAIADNKIFLLPARTYFSTFWFRTKHFSDFLEYVLDLLPLYTLWAILLYSESYFADHRSFPFHRWTRSSEDKYPSFIKTIYFPFSGFYTQKRIRLLRYEFSLSCEITCSKGIERDRHYTSCTTNIGQRAINGAIFHFPFANV